MVMAGGAADSQAKPCCGHSLGAIHRIANVKLLVYCAAFARGHIAPVESAGNFLLACRLRQEIAGELFDGELVEWQIAIERADDPVSVWPHGTLVVEVQTMSVAIARHI